MQNLKDIENLREVCELVLKYESITVKEIKSLGQFSPINLFVNNINTVNILTGFGRTDTCTLCLAVNRHCYKCFYSKQNGCCYDMHRKTYKAIQDAKTPMQLKIAMNKRAKHLRKMLKRFPKTSERIFKSIKEVQNVGTKS